MSKNRNDIKNSRPLSPHLSIYKFQISSVLSIAHRLSGIALFFVLALFCWWFILWTFSQFKPSYLEMLDNNLVKLLLLLASYGFFYHFCNGIRHLVWDMGRGFSIKEVNYSGWAVIFLSLVLTFVYWMFV